MSTDPPPIVLLVDDDPVILRLLEVNFRLAGFGVMTASRGDLAVEMAADSAPDAVVSDVMMPGLDGYGVCHRLRAMPGLEKIPFIFLTARAEEEGRIRQESLGYAEFATKPFDPTDLVAVVRRMLARAPA
jgi:DNA-binding response OmpR family regulator